MLKLPSTATGITVKVKAIDAGYIEMASSLFFENPILGPSWVAPIYTFLIDHPGGHRVMFDLGVRKDQEKLPPRVAKAWAQCATIGPFAMRVDEDVSEQLTKGGVDLKSLNAVIWSHRHADHIGDMSTLPGSVDLVVGFGTELRPYPLLETSGLIESDISGRKITVLSFEDAKTRIADMPALDYFGDGSLYILDTPGHCTGHVSALARVTPETFVLLGGDCCHHVGSLRPSKHHPNCSEDATPMLRLGKNMYEDVDVATKTVAKLAELDAHPDVLTLLSHDITLKGIIDEFPKSVDAWKENGWKDKLLWAFKDTAPA